MCRSRRSSPLMLFAASLVLVGLPFCLSQASTSPPAGFTPPGPPAATRLNTVTLAQVPPDITSIRSCLPFNLLVSANQTAAGGNGTFVLQADDSVISAVQANLTDGVLTISVTNDFRTNHHIFATVSVPDPTTLRYVQNFGVADVIVGPGFAPPNFTISSTGVGGVYVVGLSTPKLRVISAGISNVLFNGNVTDADVQVDGTSRVYLTGAVSGHANVQLNGVTTTYIEGTPATTIQGTADGLAKVLYTAGTCSVTSSFQPLFGINIFGNPCNLVTSSAEPVAAPMWTCGLWSRGRSECAGSASDAAPPLTGTQGPTTRTVTGPGGMVTTSTTTSGPGSSATAGGLVGGPGTSPIGQIESSVGGRAPTVVRVGGPPVSSADEQSAAPGGWRSDLVDVSLPSSAAGLATVNIDCADRPRNLPVLPST